MLKLMSMKEKTKQPQTALQLRLRVACERRTLLRHIRRQAQEDASAELDLTLASAATEPTLPPPVLSSLFHHIHPAVYHITAYPRVPASTSISHRRQRLHAPFASPTPHPRRPASPRDAHSSLPPARNDTKDCFLDGVGEVEQRATSWEKDGPIGSFTAPTAEIRRQKKLPPAQGWTSCTRPPRPHLNTFSPFTDDR